MIASLSLSSVVAVGSFLTALAAMGAVWSLMEHRAPAAAAPLSAVRAPADLPPVTRALSALAAPRDPNAEATIRELLVQAGYRSNAAYASFLALRAAVTLALGVTGWLVTWEAALLWRFTAVVGLAAAGWLGVMFGLRWVRHRRRERIRHSVPNMLDMLVSCVEAGLGIDVAMRHVAGEIGVASPELAIEMSQMNGELSAGIPRTRALEGLAHRTAVADLEALANVLGMVDRYGSGVAQSLRAHAQLSRRRRALQAEQRAARASPLLTVVMVLFILPPLFVVLLGPTFLQAASWVFPGAAGGWM